MSNEPKIRVYEHEGATVVEPIDCNCGSCDERSHNSDCAVHNAPAYPPGECDCGAAS